MVDGRRALLAFVRGESNWRSLRDLGLQIEVGPEVKVSVPSNSPVVRPNLTDVAVGYLSHADAAARQQWASVFLAIDIDFAALEQEKDWPVLLEAIWDASRGAVSEASIELARSLIVGPPTMH
jgi:hypothetical protein